MSLVVLRGGLASGAEPHPRRSPRPAPEQSAPSAGMVLRSRSPTRHSSAEAPGPGGSPLDSSVQASPALPGGTDRPACRSRAAGQCCRAVLSGKAYDDP